MNVKERNYPKSMGFNKTAVNYSNFQHVDSVCYPEYLLFFSNLRYLVGLRFASFNEFTRLLYAAYGVRVLDSRVAGYEKGFYKTAQYNWLKAIAVFLGADVHEMMQVSFKDRDERLKDSASK